MTFWESYPTLYGNLAVTFIVAGVLFILACIITPLAQPWTLTVIEFLKTVPIPRLLLNDSVIKWICDGVSRYFDHELVFDGMTKEEFESDRYLKCLLPHGVIPFSFFCLYDKTGFKKDQHVFAVTHHLYNFPVLLQILQHMRIIPTDYGMMKSSLKNRSLVVYPGGAREIFATDHRKEILVIRKRKGVFRMALQTGTPMVPIYTFGMTTLHERSGVSVTLPFFFQNETDTIAMYYGRYYTLYPMRRKLLTVIGSPIAVNKTENPTEKQIRSLRKRFQKDVRALYEKWRGKYDPEWEERKLIFR